MMVDDTKIERSLQYLAIIIITVIVLSIPTTASDHYEPSNGDSANIIDDASSSGFSNNMGGSGSVSGSVTIDWNEDTEGDGWQSNSDVTVEVYLNHLKADCETFQLTYIGAGTLNGGINTIGEDEIDISGGYDIDNFYDEVELQIVVKLDNFGGPGGSDGTTDEWDGPYLAKTFSYDTSSCSEIDASFDWDPTNPMTGDDVTVDGSGSSIGGNLNLDYDWEFDTRYGTETRTGQSFDYSWLDDGSWDVTLEVSQQSDSSNSESITQSIDVDSIDPQIDYSPSNPVQNQEITFDASETTYEGSDTLSYDWEFSTPVAPDPITKSGQEVTHDWGTTGIKAATLTVSEQDGSASESTTANIDVQDGSPANFDVTITDTNQPIAGSTAEIQADIENTGTVTDEQEICLDWGGETCVDSVTEELDGGGTTSVSFSVDTEPADEGTKSITVASDDDSASTEMTIEANDGPELDVSIDGTNSPVFEEDTLEVDVTFENIDSYDGEGPVSFDWDGLTSSESQSVTLDSGETTTITFSTTPEQGDAGDYTVEASTADDNTASTSITIDALEEGTLSAEVTDSNDPATASLLAKLDVMIENTGDLEESATICFDWTHEDDCQETREITLDGGESREYEHSYSTSEGYTGERTVNIRTDSGDQLASKTFTIEEQEGPYPEWDVSCDASGGGVEWNCDIGESGQCHPQSTMAEGTHEITVTCEDDVAHTTDSSTQTVTVDRTPPTVSLDATIPSDWTNETRDIGLDCSDAVSGCDPDTYGIAMVEDNPDTSAPTSCPTNPGAYSVETVHELDDYRWLCVGAQDKAGNFATDGPYEFLIDTTPPSAAVTGPTAADHFGHTSSQGSDDSPWFNDDFTASLSMTDPGPSDTTCEIRITNDGTTQTETIDCDRETYPISVPGNCTESGFNTCQMEAYAIDQAENSDSGTRATSIDIIPPDISCDGQCLPEEVGTGIDYPVVASIDDTHAGLRYASVCEDENCEQIRCDISDGNCLLSAQNAPKNGKELFIEAVDYLGNTEIRTFDLTIKQTAGGICTEDSDCMSGTCNTDEQVCAPGEEIPPSIDIE